MRALTAGWHMRKTFRGAVKAPEGGDGEEGLDLGDFHSFGSFQLVSQFSDSLRAGSRTRADDILLSKTCVADRYSVIMAIQTFRLTEAGKNAQNQPP